MTEKPTKFRTVNTTLGKQPNIGPFPANQILPWAMIAGISYYVFHVLMKFNWLWTGTVAFWLISTWWVLTANGSWRILSKFIAVPHWVRVRGNYHPLHIKNYKRRG